MILNKHGPIYLGKHFYLDSKSLNKIILSVQLSSYVTDASWLQLDHVLQHFQLFLPILIILDHFLFLFVLIVGVRKGRGEQADRYGYYYDPTGGSDSGKYSTLFSIDYIASLDLNST